MGDMGDLVPTVPGRVTEELEQLRTEMSAMREAMSGETRAVSTPCLSFTIAT